MKIDRRFLEPNAALRLVSGGRVTGLREGKRRSIFRGQGVEFADYRPYVSGDDLRWVDWNVYARLGQWVVRSFHEERVLGVRLLLDCSASMGTGHSEKARHGANLAMVLALISLQHRDPVELLIAGGRHPMGPVTGHDLRAMPQMIRLLEAAEPAGDARLSDGLNAIQRRHPKDLIVAISDGLWSNERRSETLKRLVAAGRRAVFLHVLGTAERSPHLEHGQRIEDAETGAVHRIQWDGPAREAYQRHLQQWCADFEADCCRLGIHYRPCWTDEGVLESLSDNALAGAAT
jgi:uncharacterized protein (DUF58 family)